MSGHFCPLPILNCEGADSSIATQTESKPDYLWMFFDFEELGEEDEGIL